MNFKIFTYSRKFSSLKAPNLHLPRKIADVKVNNLLCNTRMSQHFTSFASQRRGHNSISLSSEVIHSHATLLTFLRNRVRSHSRWNFSCNLLDQLIIIPTGKTCVARSTSVSSHSGDYERRSDRVTSFSSLGPLSNDASSFLTEGKGFRRMMRSFIVWEATLMTT